MPSRILREGIITSIQVNSLSWAAEIFYRRLMSIADDFGRYYAHPTLLKAALYPLQLEKVSDSDVGKWILETEEAGLIRVYSVQGSRYLEICKFNQHIRAKRSKFPSITDATHAAIQMRAPCTAASEGISSKLIDDHGLANATHDAMHDAMHDALHDAKQMRPNAHSNANAKTNAHAEAHGEHVPLPEHGKNGAPQPSKEPPESAEGEERAEVEESAEGEGYGAWSADLLRIARDAGAEFNISPAKIPELNEWIRLVGYPLARDCLDEARARKGISGYRALQYIQPMSISRKAENDLKNKRPSHHLGGVALRQDR